MFHRGRWLLRSVVVDNFDFIGYTLPPDEADTPLIVDANAVLAFTVTPECLQPIAWRHSQIVQPRRKMHLCQLAPGHTTHVGAEPPTVSVLPKLLG